MFARYLTEYDLYVASWRRDGVVQIQKKQCGVYTTLKRIPNYPPPAPNQWHHIRFEAQGTHLRLYTDGQLAVETTDDYVRRRCVGHPHRRRPGRVHRQLERVRALST